MIHNAWIVNMIIFIISKTFEIVMIVMTMTMIVLVMFGPRVRGEHAVSATSRFGYDRFSYEPLRLQTASAADRFGYEPLRLRSGENLVCFRQKRRS